MAKLSDEHKVEKARAANKIKTAKTDVNVRITAKKHAALIDSIILNGASFLIKDAALRVASRLLKALAK